MTEFIRNLIGSDLWATVIMSFVPLLELKGAIIFARGATMGFFESFGLAYLGSTLMFIPVFFLLRPILNLLKRIKWFSKFANKVESYFQHKADSVSEERKKKNKSGKLTENLLKQIGVSIFVAIPLPMTGVWTGTAIAVFLNMKFKDAALPIILGNFVAGAIISFLAQICIWIWNTATVLDYILYGLFALAIILLIVVIIKIVRSKPQINSGDNDAQK